jgi:hypothetical protein
MTGIGNISETRQGLGPALRLTVTLAAQRALNRIPTQRVGTRKGVASATVD